jgi:tyrosyl-tRNA synthetase
MLAPEEIDANARTFQDQAFKILDRDRTEVRFNSEWLRMPPEDLLGLMARTTVAQLLEREDFRNRMEADEPISALELLSPLLQGYDSVAIGADVELGGTDQTFNLLFGRAVQASYETGQQAIMTMPILPGLDGLRRMSKSLGNYVGVTDPPDEMFGKLMSIPDAVLPEYRSLLLPGLVDTDQPPNLAKREMARLLVDRFHGEGAGEEAEAAFDRVFVQREAPEEVAEYVALHQGYPHQAVAVAHVRRENPLLFAPVAKVIDRLVAVDSGMSTAMFDSMKSKEWRVEGHVSGAVWEK